MADIDINLFGEHDKPDNHPDTVENIPLTPGGAMGGSTWYQKMNKKCHLKEGKLKKECSPILTSTVVQGVI